MIELTAEQAGAHNLPPIGFTVDLTGSALSATLFPMPDVYLRASGPPGGPLMFTVWSASPGGAASLPEQVRARFRSPPVFGEAATLELAGAARPALAFMTGSSLSKTTWCAVLVETPSGGLLITFGVGSTRPLSCAEVAAHSALATVVSSFKLTARRPSRAAYGPAIGIVEENFGPGFTLAVPKSTVTIRGWEGGLAKASLPRALGALLGLTVGNATASQLAAAIADLLTKQGLFSMGTLAARYLEWRRDASEVGELFGQSLDLIARGCPAQRAGRLVWEQHGRATDDDGALSRTAIIGVLFAGQPEIRRTLSLTETAITHFDPHCQLASAALDAAIAHALTARPSPASMLRAAQDEVCDAATAMRALYPDAIGEIMRAEETLLGDLAAAREEEGGSHELGALRYAFRGAFWELLNAADFTTAIENTRARGGNAAVVGALLGAFYGVDAIPREAVDAALRGTAPAEGTDFHPRSFLRALAHGFGARRDPDTVARLSPYVALAFPAYAEPTGALPPTGDLAINDEWRISEWLRGDLVSGQARCRKDGQRAIATVTRGRRSFAETELRGVACVAPLLGVVNVEHDAAVTSVLLEAEPAGIPLSTPALPLRGRLALPLFAQLIAVARAAAAHQIALAGLRPEGIYVTRGDTGSVISGVLPRADRFLTHHAGPGERTKSPFTTIHVAPEVARGELATPAADVFSACSVYVFLTQRRSVYQAASAADPLSPRPLNALELPGALDRSVEQAIRAGLDIEPRNRPSADEIASVLDAAGTSVPACPVFLAANEGTT